MKTDFEASRALLWHWYTCRHLQHHYHTGA